MIQDTALGFTLFRDKSNNPLKISRFRVVFVLSKDTIVWN